MTPTVKISAPVGATNEPLTLPTLATVTLLLLSAKLVLICPGATYWPNAGSAKANAAKKDFCEVVDMSNFEIT
jgi:hypothetical protein